MVSSVARWGKPEGASRRACAFGTSVVAVKHFLGCECGLVKGGWVLVEGTVFAVRGGSTQKKWCYFTGGKEIARLLAVRRYKTQ